MTGPLLLQNTPARKKGKRYKEKKVNAKKEVIEEGKSYLLKVKQEEFLIEIGKPVSQQIE